jgi:hypothetical protein
MKCVLVGQDGHRVLAVVARGLVLLHVQLCFGRATSESGGKRQVTLRAAATANCP